MTKIIGHRGARGLAAENTLASIATALEAGVDMVEVDVRVTQDGVPLLVHDQSVASLAVADHTLAKLSKEAGDLATLEDAIRAVGHRVPLLIEVKRGAAVQPVVDVLQSLLKKGWKPEEFWLGSKSQKSLLTLHDALPKCPTVVIEAWSGVRASYRARQLKTKHISMNQLFLWWGFIRSMYLSGYNITAYTLNSPRKAAYWAKHGLWGVVTDYPDRYKE